MTGAVRLDRAPHPYTGGADAARTPLLRLDSVSKRFVRAPDLAGRIANALGAGIRTEIVRAVDRVSLEIHEGEVLGLVGESGCGKSTLGRMAARISRPSEGQVHFRGDDVAGLKGDAARRAALQIQMIFQDPFASLNPRMKVGAIIGEAPRVHGVVPGGEVASHVAEVMRRVGLDPAMRSRYPHQFSGGQRQRIGIARALAVRPSLIVCDEAVAALDVSIQAQVLNLFMRLRADLGLTYLFISHDLGVVRHLSDRVAIMYLGRIVETGPSAEVFASPNHPYTQGLLSAVPDLSTRRTSFQPVKGEIPSALAPPQGCHFHPRCPHAMPLCREVAPALSPIAPGRWSACHLNGAVVEAATVGDERNGTSG